MKNLVKFLVFILSFAVMGSAFARIDLSPIKHELEVAEGSVAIKNIKVTNNGEEAITLYTSKADFEAGNSTGTPKFIKPEDLPNPEISLSNWITIGDENITLAPDESKEVQFVVSVPENAEPGGHYGAIFFTPEIPNNAQVAVVQRIGALVLVNVPGDVKIEGNFKEPKIGIIEGKQFKEQSKFTQNPITFAIDFENTGNTHLKPKGKIELIDEDGNLLRKIGKKAKVSPQGAFIGEEVVDYIPVNDGDGNALPSSNRIFNSDWKGFGYSELDEETGKKLVKFKDFEKHYADKFDGKILKFYEQEKEKEVEKEITAKYTLYFEGKDNAREEKTLNQNFTLSYTEKYIGYNLIMLGGFSLIILLALIYLIFIKPKSNSKKEEEIRRKIMEEMKNK